MHKAPGGLHPAGEEEGPEEDLGSYISKIGCTAGVGSSFPFDDHGILFEAQQLFGKDGIHLTNQQLNCN